MNARPAGTEMMENLIRETDTRAIAEAAAAIRAGALIAFPTETVYGLGANAENGEAVARIFAAKSRPRLNPLIIHLARIDDARAQGVFSAQAERLARAFWPGPLTLVVPKSAGCTVAEIATAGLDTIALRVPGGAIAQSLLIEAGVPIAAPSANISGRVSATIAAHVAQDLGGSIAMVLDGGNTTHGIESTIVRAIEGELVSLLRAGAIERGQIEAALDCSVALAETEDITAPGQLESHYAPHARLRLDAGDVRPGEVLVAFGVPPDGVTADLNLSPSGDLVETAANLFCFLRKLDDMGAECAAIMPIPEHGFGEAINDRLLRASAPRQAQEEKQT